MIRSQRAIKRFRVAAVGSLLFLIIVILWGAYVRVSFSGDGCGDEWPTCGGSFVPIDPDAERLVEWTHRASSGLSGLWVLGLFVAAFVIFDRKHPARRAASYTLFFMVLEGAIGALIVKFRLVADNPSILRGYGTILHLVNTNLLLASALLLIYYARHAPATLKLSRSGWTIIILLLATSVTGAIAALGDGLFPSDSLQAGLRQDLDPNAHLFIKLRALHPFCAIVTAVTMIYSAGQRIGKKRGVSHAVTAINTNTLLIGLALVQIAIGVINLLLQAPAWMQIVHLLAADCVWLAALAWGWHEPSRKKARQLDPPPSQNQVAKNTA